MMRHESLRGIERSDSCACRQYSRLIRHSPALFFFSHAFLCVTTLAAGCQRPGARDGWHHEDGPHVDRGEDVSRPQVGGGNDVSLSFQRPWDGGGETIAGGEAKRMQRECQSKGGETRGRDVVRDPDLFSVSRPFRWSRVAEGSGRGVRGKPAETRVEQHRHAREAPPHAEHAAVRRLLRSLPDHPREHPHGLEAVADAQRQAGVRALPKGGGHGAGRGEAGQARIVDQSRPVRPLPSVASRLLNGEVALVFFWHF